MLMFQLAMLGFNNENSENQKIEEKKRKKKPNKDYKNTEKPKNYKKKTNKEDTELIGVKRLRNKHEDNEIEGLNKRKESEDENHLIKPNETTLDLRNEKNIRKIEENNPNQNKSSPMFHVENQGYHSQDLTENHNLDVNKIDHQKIDDFLTINKKNTKQKQQIKKNTTIIERIRRFIKNVMKFLKNSLLVVLVLILLIIALIKANSSLFDIYKSKKKIINEKYSREFLENMNDFHDKFSEKTSVKIDQVTTTLRKFTSDAIRVNIIKQDTSWFFADKMSNMHNIDLLIKELEKLNFKYIKIEDSNKITKLLKYFIVDHLTKYVNQKSIDYIEESFLQKKPNIEAINEMEFINFGTKVFKYILECLSGFLIKEKNHKYIIKNNQSNYSIYGFLESIISYLNSKKRDQILQDINEIAKNPDHFTNILEEIFT